MCAEGQLVNKDDRTSRYVFNVKEDDREYNQQHYDALGEVCSFASRFISLNGYFNAHVYR
jgi:hypothetical protein